MPQSYEAYSFELDPEDNIYDAGSFELDEEEKTEKPWYEKVFDTAEGYAHTARAIAETGAGLATGLAAFPISKGTKWIEYGLTGGDLEKAKAAEERTAERIQFQPTTREAQEVMEQIGEYVLDPVFGTLKEMGQLPGESWESPILRELGGDIAEIVAPYKVHRIAKTQREFYRRKPAERPMEIPLERPVERPVEIPPEPFKAEPARVVPAESIKLDEIVTEKPVAKTLPEVKVELAPREIVEPGATAGGKQLLTKVNEVIEGEYVWQNTIESVSRATVDLLEDAGKFFTETFGKNELSETGRYGTNLLTKETAPYASGGKGGAKFGITQRGEGIHDTWAKTNGLDFVPDSADAWNVHNAYHEWLHSKMKGANEETIQKTAVKATQDYFKQSPEVLKDYTETGIKNAVTLAEAKIAPIPEDIVQPGVTSGVARLSGEEAGRKWVREQIDTMAPESGEQSLRMAEAAEKKIADLKETGKRSSFWESVQDETTKMQKENRWANDLVTLDKEVIENKDQIIRWSRNQAELDGWIEKWTPEKAINEHYGKYVKGLGSASGKPLEKGETWRGRLVEMAESNVIPEETVKDIADTYNKAYKGARTQADKKVYSNNFARNIEKRVITSSGRVLSRETKAGAEMTSTIQDTYMEGERLGGKWVADYKKNVSGLSKEEKQNLVAVLEGEAKPVNSKVANAASVERENLNRPVQRLMDVPEDQRLTVSHPNIRKWSIQGERGAWELLDENGDAVLRSTKKKEVEQTLRSYLNTPFTPRENYFPRMVKREVLESKMDEAVDHLIKTGQVEKVDKITKQALDKATQREIARSKINIFIRRNSERRYGNLQIARELDLPKWAYETNPDVVLPMYYEKAGMRITQAERWGKKDQYLYNAKDRIIEEGGDGEFAQRVLDRMLFKEPFDGSADAIVRGLTGYQVVTKMGLSQVAQITQRLSSVYRTNLTSALKAQRDVFKNTEQAQDFFIRAGGGLKGVTTQARAELIGARSKTAEKFLKYTGFTKQDIQSRYVATLSGKYYAEFLVDKLKASPTSKFATRRLEGMGLNPKEIAERGFKLNDDELYKAGQKVEIDTNFRNRVLDLPEFWTSRWGRVVTQFKSFTYAQTRLLRDHVVKEALQGNVMPLVYLLTVGQVSGEVINDVRGLITGRKQPKNILERALNNYAVVGGIGVFETFFSTVKYGDTQFGATATTVKKATGAISQVAQGRLEPGAAFLLGETPVIGQRLKRELKEATESKAAKTKRRNEERYWERNPFSPRAIFPGRPPSGYNR